MNFESIDAGRIMGNHPHPANWFDKIPENGYNLNL
jgi:hypothetical protein